MSFPYFFEIRSISAINRFLRLSQISHIWLTIYHTAKRLRLRCDASQQPIRVRLLEDCLHKHSRKLVDEYYVSFNIFKLNIYTQGTLSENINIQYSHVLITVLIVIQNKRATKRSLQTPARYKNTIKFPLLPIRASNARLGPCQRLKMST